MTDFKPFAKGPPSRETSRSVSVVLDVASDACKLDPLLVQPCGGPSLLDRALDCVAWVSEAEKRFVRTTSADVASLADHDRSRGIQLLGADPDAQLGETSHVLVLDARHPFLRPSTIDEAIRLIKLRFDIVSIATCVRAPSGWWFEETSPWIEEAAGHALPTNPPGLLREAHAFHLVPSWRYRKGSRRYSGQRLDPYPFEITSSEAFRVQSDFELHLAASWFACRSETRAA